jgi:hypothetical protein
VGVASLAERRFRAHPDYEYVPFRQLSAHEQRELADLLDDRQYSGILRPRPSSGLRAKAVCADTAELFVSLADEGPLPLEFVARLCDGGADELLDLVVGEVLQVWCDGFVSGPAAHHALGQSTAGDALDVGPLAALSLAAIRHAARLPIDDPVLLAAQLYFYNRIPITSRWRRRITSPADCLAYLGLADGALAKVVDARWQRTSDPQASTGWHSWATRQREPRLRNPLTYKLYLSPTLEALPETLAAAIEVFAEEGINRFKVGRDLAGLARPDKLVAYSSDFQRIERAGQRLADLLRDAPDHGVPFTAALSAGRLISWGLDPDPEAFDPSGTGSSWRTWIATRLATALIDAKKSGVRSIEPWRFALDRVARDGIDTRSWTPTQIYDVKRSL